MKIILFLFILNFNLAQAFVQTKDVEIQKMSFDSKYHIYLSDKSKYGYDQISVALDKVFSYKKPVIFFIHGRGSEPGKSLEGGTFVEGNAVRKLEDQYNAKVLLFNWNSKASFYDRNKPLSQMNNSAESLHKVLLVLQKYLQTNSDKKIMLLAHSMGSIVLQSYFEKFGWKFPKRLFSHILLTSPDANDINHEIWLDQLAEKEIVYVTINKDDNILLKSTDARPNKALALGLGDKKVYGKKATYLDFTNIGDQPGQANDAHEIFNKPNMKNQKNICDVFHSLLISDKPDLNKAATETLQKNYLKFKFKTDQNASCFKW